MALNDRMAMIEREVTLLRDLHGTILNRITNIDISDDQTGPRLAILSEPAALATLLPTKSPASGLIVFVVAGLVVGLCLVYLLDILDDRFESPMEISEQLGAQVLTLVRKMPTSENGGFAAVQVHLAPESVESEAFRTARTALALSGQETECLAVTSAEPSDGKTIVITNLAVSFAQAGKRTLLIDCDLRRPGLTKLLDLRGEAGISDILRGADDVGEMARQRVKSTEVENLDVISAGPRPSNPLELLSSSRFTDLVAWAETAYEQVLIDGPPTLAASDSSIIGRNADGIILVVQAEKNHRRKVLRAVENLRAVKVNLLGVVVNGPKAGTRGDRYGYGYGGYGYEYEYKYGEREADEQDVLTIDSGVVEGEVAETRRAA